MSEIKEIELELIMIKEKAEKGKEELQKKHYAILSEIQFEEECLQRAETDESIDVIKLKENLENLKLEKENLENLLTTMDRVIGINDDALNMIKNFQESEQNDVPIVMEYLAKKSLEIKEINKLLS